MPDAASLVRRARHASELTQARLAARMGTTQTAVARLERSGANPRLDTLDRALRATGHQLEIHASRSTSDVDEDQLRAHMRLTAGERLEAHNQAHRNVREMAREARRST